MKAEEIFKRYGFEKSNYWDTDIISYHSIDRKIDVSIKFCNHSVYIYGKNNEPTVLGVILIEAINQQLKELGWK